MNDSTTAAVPKREAPVEGALRALEASIEIASGVAGELRSRIEATLTPDFPAPPGGQVAEKLSQEPSPLVNWIQRLRAQVDLEIATTRHTLDRLQL